MEAVENLIIKLCGKIEEMLKDGTLMSYDDIDTMERLNNMIIRLSSLNIIEADIERNGEAQRFQKFSEIIETFRCKNNEGVRE